MAAWIDVCATEEVEDEDVIRFDHAGQSFALYAGPDGRFYCTDGLCPQDEAHLSGGLVMGFRVECPRHDGGFDYRTGAAEGGAEETGAALKTHAVRVAAGRVLVDLG